MRLISFCCLTAFLLPRLLTAQDYAPSDSTGPSKLHLSAYATVNYARYNWDTDPHRRATLDLEWLVVEATYQALPRLAFEAEVEFEHGGTGGEIEFDPLEESGRFASGIDKGGEVVVEEVHATFNLTPSLDLRVGHFYVPVGSLSSKYEPFQYPTVFRPEMEEALLPAQWDETGIELMGTPAAGAISWESSTVSTTAASARPTGSASASKGVSSRSGWKTWPASAAWISRRRAVW